jgi:hypothetical protein
MNWANSPNATGPAMKAEIPEVWEQAVPITITLTAFITSDQKVYEKSVVRSGPFKILTFLSKNPDSLERQCCGDLLQPG